MCLPVSPSPRPAQVFLMLAPLWEGTRVWGWIQTQLTQDPYISIFQASLSERTSPSLTSLSPATGRRRETLQRGGPRSDPPSHHTLYNLQPCHLRRAMGERNPITNTKQTWVVQLANCNIIKSQAGAGPLVPFRSSRNSGFLNERLFMTKLGFHPSPLWGAVYLLIHAPRTLPGRGWR